MTIREFVCAECGHKVVVNPRLPLDYEPTVCTPCYDSVVLPRVRMACRPLMTRLEDLLRKVHTYKADQA